MKKGTPEQQIDNIDSGFRDASKAEKLKLAKQAQAIAKKAGSDSLKAKALLILAGACFDNLLLDRGVSAAEQANAIGKTLNDLEIQSIALHRLGSLLLLKGENLTAVSNLRSALQLCKPDHSERSRIMINLAIGLKSMGRFSEALEFYQTVLNHEKGGENPTALLNIGELFIQMGQLKRARTYLLRVLELTRSSGNLKGYSIALVNLANIEMSEGNTDLALKHNKQCLSIAKKLGDEYSACVIMNNIGFAYNNQCEWKKAIAVLEKTRKVCSAHGDPEGVMSIDLNLADAYAGLKEYAKAEELAESCLEQAKGLGSKDLEKHANETLANILACQKKYKRAVELHSKSISINREQLNEEIVRTIAAMETDFTNQQDQVEASALVKENDVLEQQNQLLREQSESLKKANRELKKAIRQVHTLQEFLPVCPKCSNIRDDEGFWEKIDLYLHKRTKAKFTHSICPDCMEVLYGDFFRNLPNARKL